MSETSENAPEFDVIVIGAGAAGGLPVGAYLQKAGAKVLLVDGNNGAGIHCQSYEYQSGARCVPCAGGFAGASQASLPASRAIRSSSKTSSPATSNASPDASA